MKGAAELRLRLRASVEAMLITDEREGATLDDVNMCAAFEHHARFMSNLTSVG